MVLVPGFQSTRLVTEGALEPFFFLYTDDSIQGNTETCKQSSIMLNYEVKNRLTRWLLPGQPKTNMWKKKCHCSYACFIAAAYVLEKL